jgi:hypothetical protein
MEVRIAPHYQDRANARAIAWPIVSMTPAIDIRRNGSIADEVERFSASDIELQHQPRERLRGISLFGGEMPR